MIRLGDLFDFKNGRSFKKTEWGSTGKPIIRIQNLNNIDAGFNFFDGEYDPTIEVNKNDLLFSWSGTVGSSFGSHIWERGTGVLNQHIFKIFFKTNMVKKYAYYALFFITEEIERSVVGAVGLVHVTKKSLNEFKIPAPPLPEQECIVAILDQAFADIEKARAKTEQNLKNARELFESYLQQVFSTRGEGWEIKTISEMAETCLGKMLDKKKNKGIPMPYLRNLNVQWFEISTNDLLTMRFEDYEYDRYAIKKGDLVICEGGYPGRGAIWDQDEDIFFQKALHRVRCHKPTYNRWILYYLYLCDCNGSLKSNFTGAGIQHLTGKSLKQFAVPIPTEEMAKVYLSNIECLFGNMIELEQVYRRKLVAIDELKKSILQKAFTGQLTNKDAA